MDIQIVIDFIQRLPAEMVVPGLVVFTVLQLGKKTGVVGEDNFARVVTLLLSFFSGGGLTINGLEDGLLVGLVAVFASGSYKGWKYVQGKIAN